MATNNNLLLSRTKVANAAKSSVSQPSNALKTADQIYMDAYNAYASQLKANADAQKSELQRQSENNKNNINSSYNDSARQYYINYKQNQQALPEQLSGLGITGGASESALLKTQASYGQNLAKNESGRNSDIASADNSFLSSSASLDNDLNDKLASAYLSSAQQQAAYQAEQNEKQETESKNSSVADWNKNVYSKIAAREKEGYKVNTWADSDGKVHYAISGSANDKWNNSVQATIAKKKAAGYDVYTWTDDAGKLHYRLTGKANSTTSSASSGGSKKSGGTKVNSNNTDVSPKVSSTASTKSEVESKVNLSKVSQYAQKYAPLSLINKTNTENKLHKDYKNGKITYNEYVLIQRKLKLS